MARTNIPVRIVDRDGSIILGANGSEVDGDAVNNHEFNDNGQSIAIVRNSGASQRNVTIHYQATPDGQSVTDKTATLEAGDIKVFGPFTDPYRTGGKVHLDVDHADLKVDVISLG